jgi:hypothetical protein
MNRNRAAIPAAIMAASLFAASAHAAPPYHLPPEIEHILALPEDKIDMGMAALVFAHAIFPEHVNVFAGSREIDRLADEVRKTASTMRGPSTQALKCQPLA